MNANQKTKLLQAIQTTQDGATFPARDGDHICQILQQSVLNAKEPNDILNDIDYTVSQLQRARRIVAESQ